MAYNALVKAGPDKNIAVKIGSLKEKRGENERFF